MWKKVWCLILAFLSLLFPRGEAKANNVDNFGIGSTATSLGGAMTASSSDPFAVYYNPAGMSRSKKKQFAAGGLVLSPKVNVKRFSSATIPESNFESDSSTIVSPFLGYSSPLTENISFGIASYVPFGLNVKWSNNPSENPGAYNAYESWFLRKVITPGLSFKINDSISVGASFSIGQSQAGRKFISQNLSYALKSDVNFETDIQDDQNYSYNIGINYAPYKNISMGFVYRSRASTSFEGECSVSSNSPLPLSQTKFDVEMKNVDHPAQIQSGVSFIPMENLRIEADILWTNWSIVKNETIIFKNPSPELLQILGGNTENFERNWEDTTQLKIGVEYSLSEKITLRAGYFYDPSPIPDDSFDFEWPDGDKKTYSLGAGYKTKKWSIDMTLLYSKASTREIGAGENKNLNSSYIYGNAYAKADGDVIGSGITVSYFF